MKWESLNLHIENLLPSLVTFVLVASLFPKDLFVRIAAPPVDKLLANDFIAGGIFVATAYMLGTIAVTISRLIIDRLSEAFLRPRFLRLLSRGRLAEKSWKLINEEYREKIKATLASQNEEVKKEVIKRRERGRLVRAALVPTLLSVLVVGSNQAVWLRCLSLLPALTVILCLYAYVEATIYEECLLLEK